jgi:hypothetical protein
MKTIKHQDISRRDAMKGGIGAASLAGMGTGIAVPPRSRRRRSPLSPTRRRRNPPPAQHRR